MRIYFAADHAGFELKHTLIEYVRQLGHEPIDCGAHAFDEGDDYPGIIAAAAQKLSADAAAGADSRAIVLGGSGQGEAIVANRFAHVRCALYYGAARAQTDAAGKELSMLASTRMHNNANALSLASRFLSVREAQDAVKEWLEAPYAKEERHERRIRAIEEAAKGS